MKLHTLGYEGLTTSQVTNILLQAKVDTLIDVRELPLSRKKGFSKTALSHILNIHGIRYIHMRSLGCPRTIRHDYREDHNWRAYTIRYNQYLRTQDNALTDLLDLAAKSTCCLFCFEEDPLTCHRSLVTDRLQQIANIQVTHLAQNQIMMPALSLPVGGK